MEKLCKLLRLGKTSEEQRQLIETTASFIRRDLKVRYAGSVLGPLWIILYPLALTLISTLIFSFVFRGEVGDTPYFLFVMLGFVSWIYFSRTISHSTPSLVYNRALIVNTKFPKESIIISTTISKLIDYLLGFIIFFILFGFMQQEVKIISLLFLPLVILLQTLFQLGISFITAALNVYFRDVQNIVDIVLQIAFYGTPILYPLNILPSHIQTIIRLNPLTQIIMLYREIFFEHRINTTRLTITFFVSVIVFFTGIIVFKRLEGKFAELI